ncbi:putative protein PLEKHA9 isoform X2 [Anneissia japonica]|uniref:putative protein PLEKHA9 isoform X2 n=1 Tax=Anneissia japonica TaxID=1529436 RepID=UPI0014259B36|nr:putative protein PLEKHA9 isoform X2 [Anneissia japonica]
MSRMCKSAIIGFSCLVFITFLAWSASNPAESTKQLLSMPFEEDPDHVITSKKGDGVNAQDVYRKKPDNINYQGMGNNKTPVNGIKQELNVYPVERGSNGLNGQPQEGFASKRPETFFSSLNLTFADIHLENNSIPTDIFIQACLQMGPFLGKLGSGISLIKKEVESNLHDINRKFLEDKESYHTLQAMILSEIDSGDVMKHHTCSRSLRWIRRMFEFIAIFLEKIATGEKDMSAAGRYAYQQSISKYHNFFIRKAISEEKPFVLFYKNK